MAIISTTLPNELSLKEGDEADLRVVMQNGNLVVTKVLRQAPAKAASPDYKANLGSWNRK